MDETWAIYRRNLALNSRWNINLLLKINFGHWIKNWEQFGRWIAILPLESHLGRRINTGVIWAVKSCCMKEGKYRQKIGDLSSINHRYIADIFPPEAIFSQKRRFISLSRYITDILAIFAEISPLRFFSIKYHIDPSRYTVYQRYIVNISRYFPP